MVRMVGGSHEDEFVHFCKGIMVDAPGTDSAL